MKIDGDLKHKIQQIRDLIRAPAQEDLAILRKLTGEKEIRYQDIVYLKEKLTMLLLAKDPNNIQMLTCFSIENVLNGLLLLLKDVFKKAYTVKTIVLDPETAEVVHSETGSTFSIAIIEDPKFKSHTVLFEIEIEGRGTIIMDMFQRASKFNQH